MPSFGFSAGSYLSLSRLADCQRTVNLYPEVVESGTGEARVVLYGTPGRVLFATLPKSPLRMLIAGEDRLFAVAADTLYEVFSTGAFTVLGTVELSTSPAQAFLNGTQLFVVSGTKGYLHDGINLNPVLNDILMGAYMDTYFIAQQSAANTSGTPFPNRTFQVSDPDNGMLWDPANFSVKEGYPDSLNSIVAAFEKLWLLGRQTCEVWEDVGLAPPGTPFQRMAGMFMEYGNLARWSFAIVGDSLMWLSGNTKGPAIVLQTQGYQPGRASTHAVETALQGYINQGIDITDAIGSTYEENGHLFYQLSFPTAGATWVYDRTAKLWHERGFWSTSQGKYLEDVARYHAYVFGKHLVGGGDGTGKIYQQSVALFNDVDGNPLRRLRVTPHLMDEHQYARYNQLELRAQVGVVPAALGNYEPTVGMRYSDDGSFTWSNQRMASLGKTGEHFKRAVWRQLGVGRDRVFEFVITEPIQIALIDAYVKVAKGTGA